MVRTADDFLARAIEELLQSGPRLADELAQEAGFSLAATRLRLSCLLEQERVHREKKVQPGQARWQYRWHLGPACEQLPARTTAPAQDGKQDQDAHQEELVPSQRTVRDYPAIGRRDALVAALFGRAPGSTN